MTLIPRIKKLGSLEASLRVSTATPHVANE